MSTSTMPTLFVGHGSPMNAIEDNEFSRAWQDAGQRIPHPKAILCISAHWETRGTFVTAMTAPRTIYDFYGFPPALYEVSYPAPGSPTLADRVRKLVQLAPVAEDQDWGLDHGTWSVLRCMYPKADIPTVQLSLDRTHDLPYHYDLGHQLQELRGEGVLILGSGNMVHNLRTITWGEDAFDWAQEYDAKLKQWILDGDHQPVIHYEQHGRGAQLSVNSAEHYIPLLYILGLQQAGEPVSFFSEKVTMGSISMRCVQVG